MITPLVPMVQGAFYLLLLKNETQENKVKSL